MKKTLTAILAIIMLIAMSATAFAASAEETAKYFSDKAAEYVQELKASTDFTEEAIYERIIALKNEAGFKDGNVAKDCSEFAYKVTKIAFPYDVIVSTVEIKDFTIDDIRVGDTISINNDSHYAVVISVDKENNRVFTVDGNVNGKVMWNRTVSVSRINSVRSRYPDVARFSVTPDGYLLTPDGKRVPTATDTTVPETKATSVPFNKFCPHLSKVTG